MHGCSFSCVFQGIAYCAEYICLYFNTATLKRHLSGLLRLFFSCIAVFLILMVSFKAYLNFLFICHFFKIYKTLYPHMSNSSSSRMIFLEYFTMASSTSRASNYQKVKMVLFHSVSEMPLDSWALSCINK